MRKKKLLDSRNKWARLLRLGIPYTGLLLNVLVCMLLLSGLRLIGPWPMKILIDSAFPDRDPNLLWLIIVALLLLNLFRQGISFISGYTSTYIGSRLIFDMRRKMFQHLQRLSMSYYDSTRSGEIISRLMSDVQSINSLITGTALSLLTNSFMFISLVVIIFLLDWRLATVAVLTFPLQIMTYFVFKKRMSSSSRKSARKRDEIYGSATEVLSAAKLVKSFNAETRANKSFVHDTKEAFGLSFDVNVLSMKWSSTSSILSSLGSLIVLAYGGSIVISDPERLSIGTFLAFNSYVGMLYTPVMQLITLAKQIVPTMVSVERVFEILDMVPEVQESENAVTLNDLKGKVEFRDVCFSYNDEDEVIRNVSLSVEPGEIVAFVGPSGSGKTTMANLIARFYDRTEGEILIDGYDITQLGLKVFRNQIGTVLQETHLFNGTVADNVRFGKPEATLDEIVDAAKKANAHEFIRRFPYGYRTEIGSNGIKISGGQRQRIAIARAIVKDPRILILDEATSALDTASEALVQEALSRLMKGRTTFVIAHRLSTVKGADKIVVMKDGKIEQTGTHEELLAVDGLYKELYEPQLKRPEDEKKPALKMDAA